MIPWDEIVAAAELDAAARAEPREISVEWDWERAGDSDIPGRYIAQLADALWRHQNAENFATLGALEIACAAIAGDEQARTCLDTNPAWRVA